MNFLKSFVLVAAMAAVGACSTNSGSTTAPSTNGPISAFAGTWTSAAASNSMCSSTSYTVTPTSATTANVTYAATCAGFPVSGTGTGTANGNTLNWTAAGSAAGCPFTLNGTAVPGSATNLNVTYTGTVCGSPINGNEVLKR